jgi:hypothetical protein
MGAQLAERTLKHPWCERPSPPNRSATAAKEPNRHYHAHAFSLEQNGKLPSRRCICKNSLLRRTLCSRACESNARCFHATKQSLLCVPRLSRPLCRQQVQLQLAKRGGMSVRRAAKKIMAWFTPSPGGFSF